MVKGRVAPPKCWFNIATQIKDQYTLIVQSAHLVLLKLAFTNAIQLYNLLMITLVIALYDVYRYVTGFAKRCLYAQL